MVYLEKCSLICTSNAQRLIGMNRAQGCLTSMRNSTHQATSCAIQHIRRNKITIVIIPSQSRETIFEDFKAFFQHLKTEIILIANLDEHAQFKDFKSTHQTAEQNLEKRIPSTASGFMFSLY